MLHYSRIKIIKKSNNTYVMTYFDCIQVKRKQETFNRLSEAKRKEAELIAANECNDINCPEHCIRSIEQITNVQQIRLRNALNKYYLDRDKENLSIKHYQNIKDILEHMYVICGNIQLANINMFNLWKQITIPKKIKQYGVYRLRYIKQTIGRFIRWCILNKYCNNELLNDVLNLPINARKKQQKEAVLSEEQFTHIMNDCKQEYQTFYALMFYAGLRPSEVLGLQVEDIDMQTHQLCVQRALTHHKRDKEHNTVYAVHALKHRIETDYRIIPINEQLRSYLYPYIQTEDDYNDHLYPYSIKYDEIWREAVDKTYTPKECKQLALRPYDLRHACVSRWLKKGIDIARVAQLAGHTVDVLLKTYAHVINDKGDDYIDKI